MTRASSWLERRSSPAARLLSCLTLVTATALLPLEAHASLALAALFAAVFCFVTRGGHARRLLFAYGAVLVTVTPIALAGPLDGALLRVARAAVCITFAVAFAASLPRSELGSALIALGTPRGIADTVSTLLRQLGELARVGDRLVLARQLRRATGVASMVGVLPSLLLCSVRRAECVELAMNLRGSASAGAGKGARLRLHDAWLLGAVTLLVASFYTLAGSADSDTSDVLRAGLVSSPVRP